MVSSTTPRLGPMCPPFFDVTAISSSRISWASCGSWAGASALMSAGPWIDSSRRAGGVEDGGFIRWAASGLGGRFELRESDAVLGLLQLLDLEFRVLEPGLADLQKPVALLEFREQVRERH